MMLELGLAATLLSADLDRDRSTMALAQGYCRAVAVQVFTGSRGTLTPLPAVVEQACMNEPIETLQKLRGVGNVLK
jgi:hypothetical protein